MYGTTPVPFDQTLGLKFDAGDKSLRCIGFTNREYIRDQHLSGTGVWLVLPHKDAPCSEKLFVALVKALRDANSVLVARYVYRKGTKVKVMVLMPHSESEKNQYKKNASLLMMELHFAGELKLDAVGFSFFNFLRRGWSENGISGPHLVQGRSHSGAVRSRWKFDWLDGLNERLRRRRWL